MKKTCLFLLLLGWSCGLSSMEQDIELRESIHADLQREIKVILNHLQLLPPMPEKDLVNYHVTYSQQLLQKTLQKLSNEPDRRSPSLKLKRDRLHAILGTTNSVVGLYFPNAPYQTTAQGKKFTNKLIDLHELIYAILLEKTHDYNQTRPNQMEAKLNRIASSKKLIELQGILDRTLEQYQTLLNEDTSIILQSVKICLSRDSLQNLRRLAKTTNDILGDYLEKMPYGMSLTDEFKILHNQFEEIFLYNHLSTNEPIYGTIVSHIIDKLEQMQKECEPYLDDEDFHDAIIKQQIILLNFLLEGISNQLPRIQIPQGLTATPERRNYRKKRSSP